MPLVYRLGAYAAVKRLENAVAEPYEFEGVNLSASST